MYYGHHPATEKQCGFASKLARDLKVGNTATDLLQWHAGCSKSKAQKTLSKETLSEAIDTAIAALKAGSAGSAGSAARPEQQPLSSAPQRLSRELQPAEREVHRPSRGRLDEGYAIGETNRFTKVAGGGGPDGHYWTVVAAGKRRISEGEDDTYADRHGSSWACWAHLRPATDEEAAPVVVRIARVETRKAGEEELHRAIAALPGLGRGASMPAWTAGQSPAWSRRISDYSAEVLYVTAEGVASHLPVYDDDPVIRVALAGTPEYERITAALAALK